MRIMGTLAVLILLSLTAGGCSRASGSREKFCEVLPGTEDLFHLIGDLDISDSARLEQRFDAGSAEFHKLARAAPRQIRSDMATLTETFDRVLEAVKKHPGNMGAVREELTRDSAAFLDSAKPALNVIAYAEKECGIFLDGGAAVDRTTSTPPAPVTTGSTTTTTTG